MQRRLMTRDDNQNNVQSVLRLVAGTLGIAEDELGLDSAMDNTPAWDSFEHLILCMAFEREFGIKLSMDDITSATSIRALVTLIP